jgi:hypothetical protein
LVCPILSPFSPFHILPLASSWSLSASRPLSPTCPNASETESMCCRSDAAAEESVAGLAWGICRRGSERERGARKGVEGEHGGE